MNERNNNKRSGQIMIESIVGITVALTALLSTLSLFSKSLQYNTIVDKKLVAAHLAAEGVEIVKGLVDANYAGGVDMGNGLGNDVDTYQVSYDEESRITDRNNYPLYYRNGTYSYNNESAGGVATGFVRDITTTLTRDTNGRTYIVAVSSTVRNADMETIMIEDYFYNWRQ
jgi:type II secretory pathway pseudopilin PulG